MFWVLSPELAEILLLTGSASIPADPLLDGLIAESEAAAPPVSDRGMPTSPSIGRVSYTHKAMSDMLIANPVISQDQLAIHFGYSASWISIILASDAFQAFHARRTAELIDPALRATIEDRFRGLVYRSQEILMEKLKAPASQIPENLALRTMELGARALGFGARDPVPAVQVNIENHLEVLGERLTGLLERKKAALTMDMETQDGKG